MKFTRSRDDVPPLCGTCGPRPRPTLLHEIWRTNCGRSAAQGGREEGVGVARIPDVRDAFRFGWRQALLALAGAVIVALCCAGASWGASGYDPSTDAYSMANITAADGVQAWWNAGYTGSGVDVAVIDTGVAPVAGLNAPGKVINGPDLSLESQNPSF